MRLLFIAVMLLTTSGASAQAEEIWLGIKDVEKSVSIFGEPALEVTFGDEEKTTLQKFSEKHIGKKVDFIVGKDLVLSPYIQTAIADGRILISGIFSQAERDDLANRLQTVDTQFRIIAPD